MDRFVYSFTCTNRVFLDNIFDNSTILDYPKAFNVHKTIGKLSYIIFPLLILSFIPQMIKIAGSELPRQIIIPGRDCVLLVILYGLAVYHRKNTPLHMRYMISTALVFIFPTMGRIMRLWFEIPDPTHRGLTYLIIYLILLGLIIYDNKNKMNIKPYLATLILFLISEGIVDMVFL